MSATESPASRCPRCGNELPPDAPSGICPACAFGEALAEPPAIESADRLSLKGIPLPAEQATALDDAGGRKPANANLQPRETRDKAGDRIGRYKLLEEIGEGGCGVVYVAEQEQPVRRRVALKVIKLGMDTRQVIARFEAERQALALMDHPNIAKVLDAGATETGRPYFVMELVKGVRITDYCDRNNLSTTERLDLFVQVCHAIQHAHQKGIIHRDIKPSNILVTLHDGVPVPKVIDFGIAKATTDQRLTDKTVYTAINQFIGTPAYMSPEQAELSGLDIDTRSDIYALGVLLYELLTGKTPFDARRLVEAGLDEIRRIIREEDPPRPSTRLSTLTDAEQTTIAKHRHSEPPKLQGIIRGDLDWIVMKSLDKDRTRRYETASGLAADIQRHLENEPVAARPPSAAYQLQKFARRNQTAFAAAAVVVLALLVGTVVSTWQAVRATRAKTRAEQSETKAVAAQKEAERAQGAEKQARLQANAERDAAARNLYLANMTLAQQAWDDSNIGRLRQVLDETKDSPHRGFEWYYWQKQTHLDLKTFRGHLAELSGVAYSPDGLRIVTGSNDKTAKVWEAASGRDLLTLKGHSGQVSSVAYSPDGQWIVTGSYDGQAKVWEAASGRELLALTGRSDGVCSVAYSPDGQRIVTGSENGTVKMWEAVNGRELFVFKVSTNPVMVVAFSPDGKRVATASMDKTAKVWEAASGRELLDLKGHSAGINSVAFSPDGRRTATASNDKTAKVWDAASGRELLTLNGHSDALSDVAFSRDGQRIATGSSDRTIRLWDAASGRELLTLKGHSSLIWAVAFSPDSRRIVTSSMDKTAKVWDAAGGLAAGSISGNQLSLWVRTNYVVSIVFSPDGRRIATCGDDETAKVWEAASGRELLTFKGHAKPVLSVAFSPDSRWIVTGSRDKTAKVWDAASGRELLTLNGHNAGVSSAKFSPDGQKILTFSWDQPAKLWDAASGEQLVVPTGNTNPVSFVVISPDGRRIATLGRDEVAKIWDSATGRELAMLKGHTSPVSCIDFSPDGQRIVTGSYDKTAMVWDAESGQGLFTLKGHDGEILSVAFSPDGRKIVTGGYGKTVRVWEASSGRELLTLKSSSEWCGNVAFSPDGQWIVTGGENGANVWEAARAEQVAAWQEEEQLAAQSLAGLEEEWRAGAKRQKVVLDRASIKRWLVLGPIKPAVKQSGEAALDFEQIPGEGQLRPKAGESRSIGGSALIWREMSLEAPTLNFNSILGQEATLGVAYAVCYLQAQVKQRGLAMLVGGIENGLKVYLNGKEIYRAPPGNVMLGTHREVPDLVLNAGLNVLVFKAVSGTWGWGGSICFTDAQGNPAEGITVTLDPEAKEKAALKQP